MPGDGDWNPEWDGIPASPLLPAKIQAAEESTIYASEATFSTNASGSTRYPPKSDDPKSYPPISDDVHGIPYRYGMNVALLLSGQDGVERLLNKESETDGTAASTTSYATSTETIVPSPWASHTAHAPSNQGPSVRGRGVLAGQVRRLFDIGDWSWPWKPSASPTPSVSASATPYPSFPSARFSPSSTPSRTPNWKPDPPTKLPPDLPKHVDWVAVDKVGPVKAQGTCGSCFAFAVNGALESAIAIFNASSITTTKADGTKQVLIPSLSEQHILDCSEGTCMGSGIRTTWKYVLAAGGVCTSAMYPYSGIKSTCLHNTCGPKLGKIANWFNVERNDEIALVSAIAQQPVTVAVQADLSMQFYQRGVLDGECGAAINHAVVAVGYGVDSVTGQAYYKLKNSWGPAYGESGYIRVGRGKSFNPYGHCGVQTDPTFPLLDL